MFNLTREQLINSIPLLTGELPTTLPKDEEDRFIVRWQDTLDRGIWEQFCRAWGRALWNYGTPLVFIETVEYKKSEFSFRNQSYSQQIPKGGNYAKRAEFMKTQIPYSPRNDWSSYALDAKCPLCGNIAQAFDATVNRKTVLSNAIFDFPDYFVFPNKYPPQVCGSLFVPKRHDDYSHRSGYTRDENGILFNAPISGKTRGNVLSSRDFNWLTWLCDTLGMVAVRNHVLDAMSIPEHDHFHIFPKELPAYSYFDLVLNQTHALSKQSGCFLPEGTPFDSLVIFDRDCEALVPKMTEICRKLEENGEVFTLAYYKGHLLITPRFASRIGNRPIKAGCGVGINNIDTFDEMHLHTVQQYVPLKGEFDWSRFVEID